MRVLGLVAFAIAFAGGAVHADSPTPPTGSVALLPLDADRDLELYGQPVAGEIARALVAGGIKVVIVGPKMAVPEGVRLVVDGTIKAGKGDSVTLAVRVRDPRDGTIVDTLAVVAPMHTAIDHAAEELSARVVPSVRGRLATYETPPDQHVEIRHVTRTPPAPVRHPMLVAVSGIPGTDALRTALGVVADPWAQRRHHDPKLVDAPGLAAQQVNAAGADLALIFDIQRFTVKAGAVPMARATVRVRVVDPNHTVFDRVIETDTVVGDRGIAAALPRRARRSGSPRHHRSAREAGDHELAVTRMDAMTRALVVWIVVLAGAPAYAQFIPADPAVALRDANAAATGGDWARVDALVTPLFARPLEAADLAEAHRLAGLAAFFGNHQPEAEQHFVAYLHRDLDGHLDPALYPPEVVSFFDEVRARHAIELHALRPRPKRSFVLEFVPVFAQRQNGENVKGWVLGGLVAAFAVTNVTSYFVIRSWCHDTGSTCDNSGVNHFRAAQQLETVNIVAGMGLILTYVYGVYDGVTTYRRQSREQAFAPFATPTNNGGVVGVTGSF